jgi:uncharacterized membrane protein YbhN (UPF0104 family)
VSSNGRGEIFGVDRRKALLAAGLAAALSIGAVAVVGQVASYGKVLDAFRTASTAWLPLCLAGEIIGYLGYVVAYRCVASVDGGPLLRYRDAARVIGLGLGAYVLGSGAGGLSVDFWAMHTAGADVDEAARRTLALNTLQAAALTVIAAAAAVVQLALGGGGHALLVIALVWASIVPAAFIASAIVTSRRLAPRLIAAPAHGERPHRASLRAWARWLRGAGRHAFAITIGGIVFVRHVLSHPRRYFFGLAGFPIFWIGDFFILWVALEAFGVTLDPQRLVLAEATAWALTFLPLPAGGSGFSEAAMTYTLHAVGVPLSHALSAALVYRAVNFWLPLLPAAALLTQLLKLRDDLRHARRTRRDEDAVVHAVP